MRLSKWYLDLVTDDGTAVIGYAATLRLGAGRFGWAAIHVAGSDRAHERSIAGRPELPGERDGVIQWRADRLEVEGRWRALEPETLRCLWHEGDRGVMWRCVAPKADAKVTVAGVGYTGLGYVEHIELTIAPWRLPIRELRWGRALTPGASATWIEWRGAAPLRIALIDGAFAVPAAVSDDEVRGESWRVRLTNPRVIRDATLGARLLGSIPIVERLVPPAILRTHERKLVSSAAIDVGRGATEGFAIHELVRFGDEVRR